MIKLVNDKSISFLIIFFVLFCVNTAIGKTMPYSYNCKDRISIPSKLELQDSELNTLTNRKQQVSINTPSNRIVFQQKGLNAELKTAYSKYCRVLIEYYKENINEPVYGCDDQIVVDRDILYLVHNSIEKACNINHTPLIKLLTIQPLTINGFPVLFYSYKRKGWEGKQPPVIVNVYQIFNRYESVTLTFSYRETERNLWKDVHNNITKSFSFIKKY